MVDFIALGSSQAGQAAKVGGKAANLGRLIAGGFPVPSGWVVPVDSYERFLDHDGRRAAVQDLLATINFEEEGSVDGASAAIRRLFSGQSVDGLFGDLVETLERSSPGALWAVRSSAVAEDLASASFAGQQDTYLNIPPERVPEHVLKCWASYWNGRAVAYRHQAGVPQMQAGIAVVVQKMVDARSAGIMFTTDPVSGKKDRIIIESSWGLGESIASGMVTPDRFVCDKHRCAIVERTVNRKVTAIYLSPEGSRSVEMTYEDQMASSLARDEVRALARLGKRIEQHFGCPQDVEWAVEGDDVLLLQSRPITNLAEDGETLWTRAYGDEYWADVTSPLFFSLLGEYLTKYVNHEGSEVMGYWNLTDKELLRVHKGHIYFNASVLEEVFIYNPKFSRTKELLNYFPQKDQGRIARADTKIAQRLWAEVRIAVLDNEGTIFRTDKAYKKWSREFLTGMESFDSKDLTQLTDEDLHREFVRMSELGVKHYQLIRYGMVTHSIGTNLMVKNWLASWLEDRSGVFYSKLISGLEDNKTIKTNNAMARLARSAQRDPAVRSALTGKTSREVLEMLRTDPAMRQFELELLGFLKEYGHRSHTREMYFPRWGDDPALVIDVLKALAASEISDPEKMERDKARERRETEKEVMERIGKLRFGLFKRTAFQLVLHYAQVYLMFRENQRFFLDHIIYRWRRLFMEYGRRFAERGIISSPTDIFFLSKEEIFEIARTGHGDVKGTVAERREEFERYRNVLPPKFLRGNVEFDDTVVRDADATRVNGVSASPGVVTGRIRVVEAIEHLPSIEDGEIMVTSNTDPGWTAVFSKLGGLITETGGILSHGAVVSREYGIPAVTAVKDATRTFRTGQKVTLDGNDGTIYILRED